MKQLELALKAVADPTRTRILKLLETRPLCVCQVQSVLGLAPSTISKHLSLLRHAGLVEDRRDGKWIEYALVRRSHNPHAPGVLALLRRELGDDPVLETDLARLREVARIPLDTLCSLPARKVPMPPRLRPRKERSRG